jgi:hypothetical protein
MTDETSATPPVRHGADLVLEAGPLHLRAKVRINSGGLMAVGGLVSSILLSTAVLVWVATTPVRRHPVAARLRRP